MGLGWSRLTRMPARLGAVLAVIERFVTTGGGRGFLMKALWLTRKSEWIAYARRRQTIASHRRSTRSRRRWRNIPPCRNPETLCQPRFWAFAASAE